jgi:hypothetical protein
MNGQYNIWNKWDPLKTVLLGQCYSPEFFRDIKNDRIRSALTKISEETIEDLANYEQVLKDFGCEVIRPELDRNDSIMNYINENGAVNGKQGVPRSPLQPRDAHAIIGNQGLIVGEDHPSLGAALRKYNPDTIGYEDYHVREEVYNQIRCTESGDWPSYAEYLQNYDNREFFKPNVWEDLKRVSDLGRMFMTSSANSFLVGNRLYSTSTEDDQYIKDSKLLKDYDIIFHEFDGHTDGNFHPIKPGAILSLRDVQNYANTFPGWDVCYLPDQSWEKISAFKKLKKQVHGKWWVPGQEDNTEFTYFVETWLNDWVGYVEETVFDVNVLVLDEKHVCVSQQNNEQVNNFLKKHGMEPVYIPWRHRYFWDGGLHCITLELYRDGVKQDYFKG